MNRPLIGNCSIRLRSSTVDSVGLLVVISGVTSPATVTDVAVEPGRIITSTTADCPAASVNVPFHGSIPANSTATW